MTLTDQIIPWICPHCEREYGTRRGLTTHIKRCETRPPRERLENLIEQGHTISSMADTLNMKKGTLIGFLNDEALSTSRGAMARRRRNYEVLDCCPGLAPQLQNYCSVCELNSHCQFILEQDGDGAIEWLPCEAPEVKDVQASGRRWPRF